MENKKEPKKYYIDYTTVKQKMGWICPNCNVAYSPEVKNCSCEKKESIEDNKQQLLID